MAAAGRPDHPTDLRQLIQESVRKASAQQARLRRLSTRATILNILLSSLSTLVAGQAALLGRPMGGEGDAAWRLVCALAAGLALGATVVASLQMQLVKPELLTEVSTCLARLRALQIDTLATDYDVAEARTRYSQILTEFPRVES